MASQKKTVQFDLFKAYYLKKNKDGSQQECLYDLTGLLQHIANHPFSDTKKKFSAIHKCFMYVGRMQNLLYGNFNFYICEKKCFLVLQMTAAHMS